MRSSSVVACYLIKKCNIPYKDFINIIKEQNSYYLLSIYNFNKVLQYVNEIHNK